MKKTIIIKGCVFTIVFLLSLLVFNSYYSRKNEGATEMISPTLPVLEVYLDDIPVNRMHGYMGEVDGVLLREAVTPVSLEKELKLVVSDYDHDITAIHYAVFQGNEEEPLEEGVLNKLTEEGGKKVGMLTFESTFQEGAEYLIRYTVRLDSSRKVNYYSRLKYGNNFHYKECIDFAKELSGLMLAKDESLNRYLEPNSEMINNNLASVNIHSSFAAVTYALAVPERLGEIAATIKEVNEDYTVVELRWILSMKNGKGQQQTCDVIETYKIRYSTNRMYLLDYSRTQDAFYNSDYIDKAKNRIPLGTGLVGDLEYLADEENEKVCFVKNRQLWYYSYLNTSVTRVFSFWEEDKTDERSGYNQHDIHILNMDQDGNIEFIVYGYMNRGRHEGQNGIAVYRFVAADSTLMELAFIPSTIPYQNMKEDLKKFSYLNQQEVFFFLQNSVLYQVDTLSGEWKILRNNLISNTLTASSDKHLIAIQEKEDSTVNERIDIINLETGEEYSVTCKEEERIQSVGFVLSDFVYGIASASEVGMTNSGALLFPMNQLIIMDEKGNEVKSYEKEGECILQGAIAGNVIKINYGKKSGEEYEETVVDHIVYKEESKGQKVQVEYGYDGTCYNQVYLTFPPYIYIQTVPFLKGAKELISDDMLIVNLVEEKSETEQYLVYANGVLAETYLTVAQAIEKADEIRGLVVNNLRQTVWESNIPSYNQVVGLNNQKIEDAKDSFAACVAMVAALEGQEVSLTDIQHQEGNPWEVLEHFTGKTGLNLYGITVDQMLYYVGKETPVIACLGGDHYVLIMSYNNSRIRYKDPLTGEDGVTSRGEFETMAGSYGNEFYSYVR